MTITPTTPSSPAPSRWSDVAIKPSTPFTIRLPRHEHGLSQDEEWCEVHINNAWRRIRFHDYDEIYNIPGLYEALFYKTLKCASPRRVVGLLGDAVEDAMENASDLSVIDVGAGNGVVGQRLRELGARSVVGVDIIPEAEAAARRDRPDVYDDYVTADLCALTGPQRARLTEHDPNCLTCVAALGFNDVPPRAFAGAFNLLPDPGWAAFNLNENFLKGEDYTGFARLVRAMQNNGVLEMRAYRRYPHRLAVDGTLLHYVALVGRKRRDIPASMLDALGG